MFHRKDRGVVNFFALIGFTIWILPRTAAPVAAQTPQPTYSLAVLQYRGGGDWYANPTAVPNLARFCSRELGIRLSEEAPFVEVGSPELADYPFVHMTGHGNVTFSPAEARNLRSYLLGGGFLHISDNYGMDAFIRREMKKVFPDAEWVEVPFNHAIYRAPYTFRNGLPKIHEHDMKPPEGWGIFVEGRLVVFYDYQCDLGDGWEDAQVHRDPEAVRRKAFEMGANLVRYAFEY
jgi:hypothetical protein